MPSNCKLPSSVPPSTVPSPCVRIENVGSAARCCAGVHSNQPGTSPASVCCNGHRWPDPISQTRTSAAVRKQPPGSSARDTAKTCNVACASAAKLLRVGLSRRVASRSTPASPPPSATPCSTATHSCIAPSPIVALLGSLSWQCSASDSSAWPGILRLPLAACAAQILSARAAPTIAGSSATRSSTGGRAPCSTVSAHTTSQSTPKRCAWMANFLCFTCAGLAAGCALSSASSACTCSSVAGAALCTRRSTSLLPTCVCFFTEPARATRTSGPNTEAAASRTVETMSSSTRGSRRFSMLSDSTTRVKAWASRRRT
mmetsp:Transcript_39156/g.103165  ORF Transcript_39156/g.103165 Transcript_39156/m.103165 type:complete len:315 (+) Transcript_39156:2788-3732(+)